MAVSEWSTQVKGTGAYADVNGIHLYYETHGAGKPMILLHGGLGSGEMFGPILPMLSSGNKHPRRLPSLEHRRRRSPLRGRRGVGPCR